MGRFVATTVVAIVGLLGWAGMARAVTITEFTSGISAPDTVPWEIAPGPDGNVWFTELFGNRIGRITPAGEMTDFPGRPQITRPIGIAAGPDGNLWVTAGPSPNRVLRVDTSGVVTGTFTQNVSIFGQPDDITPGPDGNLWFTMPNGDNVSRITTSGVVTAFPLAFNTGPQGVAAGPDGAIWFLERFPNRIGRIATNGSGLLETSIGITPDAGLEEIAAGPDGNLWFTEFSTDKVGRITPAGAVTEFPLTPGSGPEGITAGPDGNVWFAEVNGNRIGRITPDGVVREFSAGISSGAGPRDITLGPDGNLWFTESSGNRIGRVVLDGPQAATIGAVDVTPTSARLTATVNPMDYPTDHSFDFGTTTAYGAQTAPAPAGSGQGNVVVASTVTGLSPDTTYHFRVVARNRVGTATGSDATFTTPPDPDRDKDGFPRPADCNDDRADIFPGARDRPGDRIDQDCSGADAPFPILNVGVSGFFSVFKRHAIFTALSVRNAPAGATIRMRCRGGRDRGCPFRTHTRRVRRATRQVNLLQPVKRARLRRGVVFELRVTKAGFVGKLTRWKIRPPRVPMRTDRCLPPGATRPTRC